MAAPTRPKVTVGVPTLDREEVLIDTLRTILGQDYENFEVIVADQTTNRKPDFIEKVEQLSEPRLRYFRIMPASLPAARNFILERSEGELILFIDDDMKLKPGFISAHVKEHNDRPEITVVAGRIDQKNLPSSEHPLYFDKYGLPQGTFNCTISGPCRMFPGGNHSVKTDVLRKIGGYHTAYKKAAIREESDAAWRLHKAGYKMFFSAEAAAFHLSAPHGGTRIHIKQFDDFGFYVNDLLFMLRTVKLRHMPVALFRRLRIYSGGDGAVRRWVRAGLLMGGFLTALGRLCFERKNFTATEVRP